MNIGQGDTISVAADTLSIPSQQAEFSLGRIIPLISTPEIRDNAGDEISGLRVDYIAGLGRIDGEPRPPGPVNTDLSFILLSVSLLIIAVLTVFGRKSVISGLSSISLRRHGEVLTPGTSEVLSWPPILRNLFTIVNVGLFAAISLLYSGQLIPGLFGGSSGLTLVLAGSFLAALLIRHLTCIVLAEVTGLKSLFREYMNIIYNTWFACSIILFIINLIILFAPIDNPMPYIVSGMIIISIFLIIRALKLLLIFNDRHVSVFYFILYLCALEVLPVLVTLKILGVF